MTDTDGFTFIFLLSFALAAALYAVLMVVQASASVQNALKWLHDEIADWLKYGFGLPLYTYYLLRGTLPEKAKGPVRVAMIPSWLLVAAASAPLFVARPDLPMEQLRGLYITAIVTFLFVGCLIRAKAESAR